MSFEVNSSDYIIIDKRQKIAFAIDNTVLSHAVTYNRETGEFDYANNYDWNVSLDIETLILFYIMSQSSDKKTVKNFKESFNINFKALDYK